jgi:O-antigen/teichoic acid export membrane protein
MQVAYLGLAVATALSCGLLFVVALFKDPLANALGSAEIAPWLYCVPLVVFMTGLYNVLNYYSSRIKRYRDIANANVSKAAVTAGWQLLFGLISPHAAGLITGQVASTFASNARLLKNALSDRPKAEYARVAAVARDYADFPKYSLPAALANRLSSNLLSILISRFLSTGVLGQFALVQRVLGLPSNLVGNAIAQVFFQQASAEKRKSGNSVKLFRSTLLRLVVICVPTFLLMYVVVEDAFAFVFGEPWRQAGAMAKTMIPLFAVRFVVAPLSMMNQVNLKNRLGFGANVTLLVISVAAITGSAVSGLSVDQALETLVFGCVVFYLVFLYMIYRHTVRPQL